MSTNRIIKKYPNRRLYDTSQGIYITLADIKKLVLERVDFQVLDARTKKDLTQTTLLQIIAEQETSANPLFTNSMLQEFIRFYNEKSQRYVSHYLEQALNLLLQQKDFFKTQWEAYEKVLLNKNVMEESLKLQKNLWAAAQKKSTKKNKPK